MRRIVLLTALSVALGAGLVGGFYVASGTGAPLPAELQYETTTTADVCSGAGSPDGVSTPRNLSPPTITGTIAVGETLHVSTGTWACDPTSFVYNWFAFNHAGNPSHSPDLVVPYLDDFGVFVAACINGIPNVVQGDCSFAIEVCIRDPNNPADNQYDNPADIQYAGPERLGIRCARTSG